MTVRNSKWLLGMVFAAGLSYAATAAMGAASVSISGDDGTLRVTTYSPTTEIATAPLASPYGTSVAGNPTITEIVPNTVWKIDFTLSSVFFASANSAGGGKTTEMDGHLTFDFNTTVPISATVNVFEDGIYSKSGPGATVAATGGLIVTPVTPAPTVDQPIGNSFPTMLTNSLGPGTWQIFDQVTGFKSAYTTYKISIDNDLLAEALATTGGGTASIAKKDFTIYITSNGSPGGTPPTPEPASLGILGIGALGLLSRRRKA